MEEIGKVYSLSKSEKPKLVEKLKKDGWNVIQTTIDPGTYLIMGDERPIGDISPDNIHTMNHRGLEKFISDLMMRERLEALGFSEDTLDMETYIRIIKSASKLEDLKREFAKRKLGYDEEQFLIPIFREIYKQDETVRRSVNAELSDSAVPIEIIEKYFTKMGDQPDLTLTISKEYREILSYMKTRFRDMARKVMFREVKSYLKKK